jgi:oligopeptide transport system substrate-binding protein
VLAEEQVVFRGNGEEPATLDPQLALGVPSSHILRDLFEGLTTESPDGKLIPGAALRWNISRDARTYTFYLRRDLTWSNGEPLDASDFVYSLQRALNPETASSAANNLLPIQNAREVLAGELPVEELGISLLDEYTMQITLTGPTPYFLGLLASAVAYPVNRANVDTFGDQFSKPGNLVSNGAYVLDQWQPRVRIELVRNLRFREAEQTLIERVVYLPIEDHSTEVQRFRSGDLDWTFEVPSNQFRWLQQNYPDELVVSPWMGSYFFGYNLTREPFVDNPSLRMALNLAVDREIITEKITQFGEQPSFALVPPGIDGYVPFAPEYADWTQEEPPAARRDPLQHQREPQENRTGRRVDVETGAGRAHHVGQRRVPGVPAEPRTENHHPGVPGWLDQRLQRPLQFPGNVPYRPRPQRFRLQQQHIRCPVGRSGPGKGTSTP